MNAHQPTIRITAKATSATAAPESRAMTKMMGKYTVNGAAPGSTQLIATRSAVPTAMQAAANRYPPTELGLTKRRSCCSEGIMVGDVRAATVHTIRDDRLSAIGTSTQMNSEGRGFQASNRAVPAALGITGYR